MAEADADQLALVRATVRRSRPRATQQAPAPTLPVARVAVDVPLAETPGGPVVVRRIETGDGAADDLTRMLAAQESVFGTGRGPSVASSLAELESGGSEFWIAEVGDRVVCGGRLTPVEGTDFAGIWGGSTLPGFRGRGIYRALVAARSGVHAAGGRL